MTRLFVLVICLLGGVSEACAWWNADWAFRKKITFNTSDTGAGVKENLPLVPVAVRLHTGNFGFADASQDGADIRFIAADDKTPLKYHIESHDAANELAIAWVQMPSVAGGSSAEFIWLYYGNQKAPRADDARGTYDTNQTLVLHFAEKEGAPKDATAYAQNIRESAAKFGVPGLLGGGAVFDGAGRIVIAASPSLKLAAGGGFTFSAWVKLDGAQNAILFSQQDGARALIIGIDQTRLYARVAGGGKPAETPRNSDLGIGAWRHVAVTLGNNRLAVYLDGVETAAVAAPVPDLGGDIVLGTAPGGNGFKGALDELQLANVARSGDWIKLAFGDQGQDAKLVTVGEDEQGSSGGHSYFGILIDNLTLDAWVVIVILMIMLAISIVVMIGKALFIARTQRANDAFLERFQQLSSDLAEIDGGTAAAATAVDGSVYAHSPLYGVYHVAVRELQHRFEIYRGKGVALNLTPQALNSIRASMDADMVRETQRLNSQMVLLTIAISGGPFLGLLGTVVGVMITFAAIAAAGDVNINAIAPGIAAALLATVAGLAVAIPALFGYNYLASRIKSINGSMQVFADELITKLAENYSS